jgi:hypothetical protein
MDFKIRIAQQSDSAELRDLYETYISILTPSSKFLSLPVLDNL